jgi:hypothetical protein
MKFSLRFDAMSVRDMDSVECDGSNILGVKRYVSFHETELSYIIVVPGELCFYSRFIVYAFVQLLHCLLCYVYKNWGRSMEKYSGILYDSNKTGRNAY